MITATAVVKKASRAMIDAKSEPTKPAPRASMKAMKFRPQAIG